MTKLTIKIQRTTNVHDGQLVGLCDKRRNQAIKASQTDKNTRTTSNLQKFSQLCIVCKRLCIKGESIKPGRIWFMMGTKSVVT